MKLNLLVVAIVVLFDTKAINHLFGQVIVIAEPANGSMETPLDYGLLFTATIFVSSKENLKPTNCDIAALQGPPFPGVVLDKA